MSKILVMHRGYGCDTGCCGHFIKVDDDELDDSFEFSHPYDGEKKKFAEEMISEHMGAEHVADLDWDNCFICED